MRERDLEAVARRVHRSLAGEMAADALSRLREEGERLARALDELMKALEELGGGRRWRLKPEDYLDKLSWMPMDLAALGIGIIIGARRLAEELTAMCRAMKVRRGLEEGRREP